MANRKNVFSGLLYRDDPVIFSWNLYNVRPSLTISTALYSRTTAFQSQNEMEEEEKLCRHDRDEGHMRPPGICRARDGTYVYLQAAIWACQLHVPLNVCACLVLLFFLSMSRAYVCPYISATIASVEAYCWKSNFDCIWLLCPVSHMCPSGKETRGSLFTFCATSQEPRCPADQLGGGCPGPVTSFMNEMAAHLKSVDPNHLVQTLP
jgi:hypothetical protein